MCLTLLRGPLVPRVAEPMRRLDAIVVLGAPLARGDVLTAPLVERCRVAAELWHAGAAPIVAVTGGRTRGAARAEAEVMAEAIAALGVPDVIIERASQTTIENARLTRPLLAPRGVRSVWLVTQPFHARRAARVFRAAGFDAHVWHIAESIELEQPRRAVRWLVREYAAWAKLLLLGS